MRVPVAFVALFYFQGSLSRCFLFATVSKIARVGRYCKHYGARVISFTLAYDCIVGYVVWVGLWYRVRAWARIFESSRLCRTVVLVGAVQAYWYRCTGWGSTGVLVWAVQAYWSGQYRRTGRAGGHQANFIRVLQKVWGKNHQSFRKSVEVFHQSFQNSVGKKLGSPILSGDPNLSLQV